MITVDMDKAKIITHDKRRAWRDASFAPYDVKVTIPAEAEAAEAERVKIREANFAVKGEINLASDVPTLKAIIEKLEAK